MDRVRDKKIDILFPKDKIDSSLELIKNNLSNERSEVIEIDILTKDKDLRTVFWNSSNIFDKGGKNIVATIAQGQDITKRKCAEKELIEAKEKAEQSDKLKSEFLNQMSHEIRSPMNAVLNFTQLLKEEMLEQLTPDFLGYFDGIDSAGHRLIRTVDLILNVSEMQVGTYEPSFSEFDLLKEIIGKIKKENMKIIEDMGLKFDFLSVLLEAVIVGNQYSIYQVFVNLIDNSIKYTKKGYISINVSKNEQGINVSIKDTGIGISKEFLPRIFEPFAQEEQGYTRSYEGNGLGLALTKKYCDLNNIIIEIESEKNVGSAFRIIFDKKVTEAQN